MNWNETFIFYILYEISVIILFLVFAIEFFIRYTQLDTLNMEIQTD